MQNNNDSESLNEQERSQRIQSLREMISNAERTIQGAKAMLLQLEGKKKAGRRRKMEISEDGSEIIQGTFDGQLMLGSNNKQYPVPANYASKSKLVEGDLLKLTITSDGSFIYKQIGPVERRHALGIVTQDENGNYYVVADGKPYKILLASITYFRAEPGDEAAIVLPRDIDTQWAAIENIVQKAKEAPEILSSKDTPAEKEPEKQAEVNTPEDDKGIDDEENADPNSSDDAEADNQTEDDTEGKGSNDKSALELLEEWRADIEEIEKEMSTEKEKATEK